MSKIAEINDNTNNTICVVKPLKKPPIAIEPKSILDKSNSKSDIFSFCLSFNLIFIILYFIFYFEKVK